jgi:hypothetical protein
MTIIEFDCNVKHSFLLLNVIIGLSIFTSKKNFYTYHFSNLLSFVLSFLLYYYDLKKSKGHNEELIVSTTEKGIEVRKGNKTTKQLKTKNKKIKDYIIISLLDIYINSLSLYYLGQRIFFFLIFQIFAILSMILYYHFFLKEKIYLHHFISIIMILVFTCFHPNFYLRLIFGYKIPSIIYYVSIGITQCIKKYMMEKNFLSPYIISMINSSIQSIFNIFKVIIQKYSNQKLIYFNDFDDYLSFNFNKDYVIFIFNQSLDPILNVLTIYYFNPFYYIMSTQIAPVFSLEQNFIKNIIYSLGYFFSLMIFVELIIINFWGMSIHTKKKIKERERIIAKYDNRISNVSNSINSSLNTDINL